MENVLQLNYDLAAVCERTDETCQRSVTGASYSEHLAVLVAETSWKMNDLLAAFAFSPDSAQAG